MFFPSPAARELQVLKPGGFCAILVGDLRREGICRMNFHALLPKQRGRALQFQLPYSTSGTKKPTSRNA
jgi:hypothetical protein